MPHNHYGLDTCLRLSVGNGRESRNGVIEHVSVVADAKSGTVSVTVRIPNAEGKNPERFGLSLGPEEADEAKRRRVELTKHEGLS